MDRYTNNHGIDLAAAVWLADDDYDHVDEENYISVTGLIRPIRQIILRQRVPAEERQVDLADLVDSRIGQTLHGGVEKSWKQNYRTAMRKLGHPQRVIDMVRINPEIEEPDTIPVYTEIRTIREVDGVKIGGKLDLCIEGRLRDVKKAKVFKYLNPGKSGQWVLQGSIYRWLNPEKVRHDQLVIQYLLLDWSRGLVGRDPQYPSHAAPVRAFELMSLEATEQWIRNRLALLAQLKDAPDDQLPECDEDDLWRGPTVYKYYADPTKLTRSTKNFDNESEAVNFAASKGKGIVLPKPGLARACGYCEAASICKQRERLLLAGELAAPGP